MKLISALVFGATSALLLFLPVGASAHRNTHMHSRDHAASPAPTAADAWPELRSDLPPDPETIFGVLPNGMRYAVKQNRTPAGEVSIRLRMKAGSLDESPAEGGAAHFIEHMTFRGTTHIADGEAIKRLESLGLTMEADVNAFTSATETFFTYDLPKSDPSILDKALMLLRETASEALFDPNAMDSERQVVLAEKRARESPLLHVEMAQDRLLFGETGAALTPIGTEDVIRRATPDQLRDFYRRHYRPENATLIVVGDIDPAGLLPLIRSHFADWRGSGPGNTRPTIAPLPPDAPKIAISVEHGAPTEVQISWVKPDDGAIDSKLSDRKRLFELLGLTILDLRLQKLAAGKDLPFLTAKVGHTHLRGMPDVHRIDIVCGPKGVSAAIVAVESALFDITGNGVSQEELDRALAVFRTIFDTIDARGLTTPSAALANILLRTVDDGSTFLTPQQSAAIFRDEARTVDIQAVSQALREAFAGEGPYILVSGEREPPGGIEAVRSASETAGKTAKDALASSAAPTKPAAWPYDSFGTKGIVETRQELTDLGVTLVRFANGVEATIKPTRFRTGQVLVGATFGHGRLGLPKQHAVPVWALPTAYPLGGLKQTTYDEMNAFFETQFVGVHFQVRDDAFALLGGTRPQDFDREMQVLTAYIADPGWRSDALDKARIMELFGIGQAQSSPDGVLAREQNALLHDGDPRWSVPDLDQIGDAGPRETRSILSDALKGPLEVTIVGDITADKAIATLSNTLAALPSRRRDEPPVAADEKFAQIRNEPLILRHDGNAALAAAEIDWQTTGLFPNVQESRKIRVLQEVLLHRLFDELRTREGITYTPQLSAEASPSTPDFGYLSATADVPPDKVDAFYEAVARVVNDLKSKPIDNDELLRAREPRVNDLLRDRQTNEYWLAALTGVQTDPRRLDAIRSTVSGLEAVTSEGVQSAAQTYLRDDRAFKVVVLPKDFAPKRP